MSRFAYLKNRKVIPISIEEFVKLSLEDLDNRVVRQTKLKQLRVSTVFLQINHGTEEKPLWFETMVFDDLSRDICNDVACVRYATFEEAEHGHEEMVNAMMDVEMQFERKAIK